MTRIEDAILLIEKEVAAQRARCVIADEGCSNESSLLGTRDGYLNLVLALLRLVAGADTDDLAAVDHFWDDQVKSALYQLPNHGAWIVGAYLFKNHSAFMTELSRLVDPQVAYPLLNDPMFCDQSDDAQQS